MMKFITIFACMLALSSSSARAFTSPLLKSITATTSAAFRNTCSAVDTSVSSPSRQTLTRAMSSSSSSTAVDNPLLQQDGLPKFSSIDPSNLTPAVETLLEKMNADFARLEETLSASVSTAAASSTNKIATIDFDSVLPAVEIIQFPIGFTWGVAGHLNGVKNGEELRKTYEENQPKIIQAMSKFSQSKPLYDALSALQQQWADSDSDNENANTIAANAKDHSFEMQQKRRAVENTLREMKLGGVGLEGAAKERFNDIKMRLAALSNSFSNNILDETKAFATTIDDVSKMEGVPESAKSLWANAHAVFTKSQAAAAEGAAAAAAADVAPPMDVDQGPWRITLDMPSYIAVMQHMADRGVREQVYRAYLTRASEMSQDEAKNNIPLIYEILQLNDEMAKMLGFDNYADLSLASKMAPSVAAVTDLSELIFEKALPAAERELAEITALAREKGGDEYSEANLDKIAPWDISFWSERLKESKFELKEEETRPYFALPAVLQGMFGLVERIFGIDVRKADGDAEVWHPDVGFFKVFDSTSGKHIASFFLDPYSRPADKQGGAWMDVCIGKSEAVNRDTPVAYLTCNGSPPVGDTPSLMTFNEVETLFHEFGHGLQHMLTTVTVGDVAGINGVEWDAVELPSQFMENFCYDRKTLFGFAKHWKTGEPMPEDMFEKIKEQKTYNAGMMSCRQLLFGQLDLELHSGYDAKAGADGTGESIFDVHQRVAAKYSPFNMPLPFDRFLCGFSHIFAGGYSAGYYSYKWAEVMSADAFSAFEDVGLENEEQVQAVGRKFRETVLASGGGVPPMEVFKAFRGREPNPDAVLRHNGLS